MRLTTSQAPQRQAELISDTTVWTGQGWREHADVLISEGVVSEVADHDPARLQGLSPQSHIEGHHGYLIPGFVNTHTHVQQALCRGVGEGLPLLSWLLETGKTMAAMTPERAYLAAVAAGLEGLLSGTTTVVEHGWPNPDLEIPEAVMRGLSDVGVRFVLGVGVADRADPSRRWGFDPRLMGPLDLVLISERQINRMLESSRAQTALAVPNPRCITPDGMRAVRQHADEHGIPVMIHLSETDTDEQMCREHADMGAVEYLEQGGFLWERLLVAHGVKLSRKDATLLAQRGVTVSWNPVSNMRLGSGIAPVPQWLETGLDVSIGVDGPGSNDRQDMLETLRAGAYVHRAAAADASVLDTASMLAMACDGASGVLGAPAVGTPEGAVAAGRPADLTLVDFTRDFACLPVHDPAASLLTTGTPRIVDTVVVDGEVVVDNGMSTRIDTAQLSAALAELSSA